MALTPDSIFALAPDGGSASSARSLATPTRWSVLNAPGGVLWGHCQGSGKTPYLTAVDLDGLASKCSCPSRKFPCKHALALMLLSVTHAGSFGTDIVPDSIQVWLHGREQRAGQTVDQEAAAARKDVDPTAQARRRAARERKVSGGLAGLDMFLQDLVRDGLAHASARPYTDWDTQAARLVDAQAPGAARQVRRIPELLGDPAALLAHLAQLHLLCEAWTRRETLEAEQQADLRAALGFPLNQADLPAAQAARWDVLGQITLSEDDLTTRRSWLRCGDQMALLLDFAAAGRPLPPGLPVGQSMEAEVSFAPSADPQRAIIQGEARGAAPVGAMAGVTLETLLDTHAQALARNPWRERTAHLLGPVWLLPGWQIVDEAGRALPLVGDERLLLGLLARSAGRPVTVFGEWDGLGFLPLSLLEPSGLTPLRGREES